MRAYRKRSWASVVVNMTPLIDVVFLIIIFFIIMINFSEMHIRTVDLPKADEGRKSLTENKLKIPITIKSEQLMYWEREKIVLDDLPDVVKRVHLHPEDITVLIRANQNVSYEVIKKVMIKLARLSVHKIEFAALHEKPEPLGKE